MKKTDILNRILCTALVLALLLGIGVAVSTGSRSRPESPLKEMAEPLTADPLDGGSRSLQKRLQEQTQAEEAPEEEPSEETEQPDREPQEEPEESEPQEEPDTEAPEQMETVEPPALPLEIGEDDPERPADPNTPEDPNTGAEDPGENGNNPGPGGGEDPGSDPGTDPGGEGPSEPEEPPGPSEDEVKIATNLSNGIITETELPDGLLKFYAYGVGADDLTVRIQARNTTTKAAVWMESEDGRNWNFRMELGGQYQFTLYLDQPGQPTQYATRYVTFQAKRADENNPVIGDYPPFITTNIDHYEDGAEIEGENLALIVTVRSNPDYKAVTADKITVTLNGVPVDKHGGDSNPEYDLFFEPPNVGDYKDYKIEIVAWYENNSRYWSKTLRYHALAEGDTAGTVNIVLDATTVGVGILDSAAYEIKKGDTAADVFLRFLEDYGYEITYDATGSNFYIRRIYRGDMCYDASIPTELWNAVVRDGINLNEYQYDRDSLGEFDYTMGAGWMYAIDGAYPGRAMNRYEVKNGNTIYIRFTLAYGKDIGGFDSTGGGYGSYSSYCGLWIGGYYTPLGHSYEETDRVEPTAAEDGYVEYTCSRCGDSYRETLEKTGPGEHEHQFTETSRIEPTEKEDGYIEYTCSVCGEMYRETLPAAGVHEHQYEETSRVEPTATEDGYIEYTCTVCGETYRDTIPTAGSGEEPDPGGGGEEPLPQETGDGGEPQP